MLHRAAWVAVLTALAMAAGSNLAGADPEEEGHAQAFSSVEQATIVQAEGANSCAGDRATLNWSPPDVEGLTGYRVEHWVYTPSPRAVLTEVRLEQTSLPFALEPGLNIFLVYAVTTDGLAGSPFADSFIVGNHTPHAMAWPVEGAAIGDGTATTSFRWFGPVKLSTRGGELPVTVQVAASPGGASVKGVLATAEDSYTATFEDLTNGTAYTFTAVTSNACGSSAPSSSPSFTPGVAPTWVRADPPLSAGSTGHYVYKFAADGDPRPTYRLVDAPSWLEISPNGLVRGRPPEGISSFSYSVVASNGVGIAHPSFATTDVVSGPFSVSVEGARPHLVKSRQ